MKYFTWFVMPSRKGSMKGNPTKSHVFLNQSQTHATPNSRETASQEVANEPADANISNQPLNEKQERHCAASQCIFSINSGDQPHFQDVAPPFVHTISRNIITAKFNEHLDDKKFSFYMYL